MSSRQKSSKRLIGSIGIFRSSRCEAYIGSADTDLRIGLENDRVIRVRERKSRFGICGSSGGKPDCH
jgi:hypothetical protein